jgi:hypothetical protein
MRSMYDRFRGEAHLVWTLPGRGVRPCPDVRPALVGPREAPHRVARKMVSIPADRASFVVKERFESRLYHNCGIKTAPTPAESTRESRPDVSSGPGGVARESLRDPGRVATATIHHHHETQVGIAMKKFVLTVVGAATTIVAATAGVAPVVR